MTQKNDSKAFRIPRALEKINFKEESQNFHSKNSSKVDANLNICHSCVILYRMVKDYTNTKKKNEKKNF